MVITVLLLGLGVSFGSGCYYARFSPTHTMCAYSGPGCPLYRSGMYQEEIDRILDAHNELRSKVAMGRQPGQPPAANMKKLKWDNELAAVAQRLAEQCVGNHDRGAERATFGYKSVGQNIIPQVAYDLRDFDMMTVVEGIFEEVKDVKRSIIDSFPRGNYYLFVGHYTQLVWAKTEAVGCGLSKYFQNNLYVTQIICNYGPAGNVIGGKIYEVGEACSRCPEGRPCSQVYAGLCL